MAISFVGVTTSTSDSIAVPEGVQDGDLLLLEIYCYDSGPSFDSGTTWTLIDTRAPSGICRVSWYWRKAQNEPASYPITFINGYRGLIHLVALSAWRGVRTDIAPQFAVSGPYPDQSTYTHPALTTTVDGCEILWAIGGLPVYAWNFTWTPPSGATSRYQQRLAYGYGVLAAASMSQAVAGDTGTVTSTAPKASTIYAYTFALEPVPPPPSVNFSGVAAGAARATGLPAVERRLSSVTIGTARTSGIMTVTRLLGGTCTGAANTWGAPFNITLSGTANGQAATRGLLTVVRALTAQAAGSTEARGQVAISRLFSGTAAGAAWTTGDVHLIAGVLLSARGAGEAGVTGLLALPRFFTGLGAGRTALTGTPIVTRGLSGSGAGRAMTTGALVIVRILTGQANGAAQSTGALSVTRAFAGSAAGRAATSGAFGFIRVLGGTAVGTAFGSVPTPRWVFEGILEGLSTADAILFECFTGIAEGLGDATVAGVIAAEAVGAFAGDGLAVVLIPTESLVLSPAVQLEPGDLVWVVAPLAGLQGRTGLCRVLAVEHDPDRGEARYQVQLIEMSRVEDVQALNELGRPRVAINRTTSLARQLREAKRGQG